MNTHCSPLPRIRYGQSIFLLRRRGRVETRWLGLGVELLSALVRRWSSCVLQPLITVTIRCSRLQSARCEQEEANRVHTALNRAVSYVIRSGTLYVIL